MPASRAACLTQFRIDQIETPNSFDSSGISRPARTSCTIWCRNSRVYRLPLFDMLNTSLCDSDVSTKAGQVHYQTYTRDSSVMTPWGLLVCQLARPERRGEWASVLDFAQRTKTSVWKA